MNLLQDLPPTAAEEQFETLLQQPGIRIERIISRGQVTPPGEDYDQSWDEWVLLLQGNAELELLPDGEKVYLTTGDYYYLPAGCRHRVTHTDRDPPTIWLALHLRQDEDAS